MIIKSMADDPHECYYCAHYYARTFTGDNGRSYRLDGCLLASGTRRRHPGVGVAEKCPDYEIVEHLRAI